LRPHGKRRVLDFLTRLYSRSIRNLARLLGRRMKRPPSLWWNKDVPLRSVPVLGHDICYVTTGQGPPLILIHGFGTSLSIWAHQINRLSDSFTIFAVDLLGHGYSDKPDIEYPLEIHTDVLAGFMDALRIRSATLTGHSFGGLVILRFATLFPDRVQRIVLVNSSTPLVQPDRQVRLFEKAQRRPWLTKRLLELLELGITFPTKYYERKSQKKVFRNQEAATPEWTHHQYLIRRAKGFSRMVVSTLEHWMESFHFKDQVPNITQPVLILCAESDPVIPLEHGRALKRTMANAKLEIVRDSGHMTTMEQPEITARMIRAFLIADHVASVSEPP